METDLLSKLTADFAQAIAEVDADRPVAFSLTTGRSYQPGIGPHTETSTLGLIRAKLLAIDPVSYGRIETGVPYPLAPRQKCDWAWTPRRTDTFYIEAKMMRLMGDNGKPNDNILCHILSPYPQQRSALTDCEKLVKAGFTGALAILIYGYEYEGYPLKPVIDAFEPPRGVPPKGHLAATGAPVARPSYDVNQKAVAVSFPRFPPLLAGVGLLEAPLTPRNGASSFEGL